MKNVAIAVLLLAALALGAFCLHQQKQMAQMRAQLAARQGQLPEETAADDKNRPGGKKDKGAAGRRWWRLRVRERKIGAGRTIAANARRRENQQSLERPRRDVQDPKMREMMKAQQKAFIGPMIEQQIHGAVSAADMTPTSPRN